MSKFVLCRLKDDIINIDLSNYQLAIFPFDKESLIKLSFCETMRDQILCKPVIKCLLEVQHMIQKVWINESFRLSHIDIFFKEPIQESNLYIHLVNLELQVTC